jgi:hypothetical protein
VLCGSLHELFSGRLSCILLVARSRKSRRAMHPPRDYAIFGSARASGVHHSYLQMQREIKGRLRRHERAYRADDPAWLSGVIYITMANKILGVQNCQ